jgi:hypothetical protein
VRARAALLPCLLVALGAAGCKRRWLYEWRDEPYIRPVFKKGEEKALARMSSMWVDDREIGVRALGALAREARERGDETKARELAGKLMTHYETERNPETRSMILAVCLREAGNGDSTVHAFLKSKLNSGEHPAAAAYCLATLRPPGTFGAISSALNHSEDFELRYELLGALWLLGDARAVPILERELAAVDEHWPERVHHMKKPDYRKALAGRLDTLKAACRAGNGK